MNSNPSEVAFYRLAREDSKIHRHDCGAWVYANNDCGACCPQIPQERAQDIRTVLGPIPRLRTGPVHERVGSDGDVGHDDLMDQRHERRAG